MELIPHEQFGRLRLLDFAPHPEEVVGLDDWEFMDKLWLGEAIGFSEWLRPVETPDVLGSLSLDLLDLPPEVSQKILAALHLRLLPGMGRQEVVSALGEPIGTHKFTSDRTTYEFRCGNKWPYQVDCTIKDEGGLSYISIVALRDL